MTLATLGWLLWFFCELPTQVSYAHGSHGEEKELLP